MKIFDIGYPEGKMVPRLRDFWKMWYASLYTQRAGRGGVTLRLGLPLIYLDVSFLESYADLHLWSGYFRFNISLDILTIIFLKISIPVGKWRRSIKYIELHYETLTKPKKGE